MSLADQKKKIDELKNTGQEYQKPLLVANQDTSGWQLDTKVQGFEPTSHNPDWTKFSIDIPTSSEVPVFVKISYFPYWHAYDRDGKKVNIYKASPNFMLVYAKGQVNFVYQKPWYYYLGYLVSFFAIAAAIASLFNKQPKYYNYWLKAKQRSFGLLKRFRS